MTITICIVSFLSTLSLRRATTSTLPSCRPGADFYPRSPCGERRPSRTPLSTTSCISIHALLAESDILRCELTRDEIISIHALLAESDLTILIALLIPQIFLSTLSLRRATYIFGGVYLCIAYFYPRSPCGERPVASNGATKSGRISIHALLAESDMAKRLIEFGKLRFLSTLSLRRATLGNAEAGSRM